MLFLRRAFVGLFLLSITLGLFAVAANMFYGAIQERMSREERQRPARERITPINVVTITPERITPELTVFGEVLSRRTLDIRASAGGRIVELAAGFEEGGAVEAGQLLARIDPTDAESALDVVRTDLAEAEAELRDAERALELARDEVVAARAQADLRAAALQRQRDLLERGVGTESAVETAALSASSADQAVLSRRQSLAQAESRIDQAKNRLARQRIALANAERDLADTEIRAAFSGTLAEVTLVEGGLVTQNERLAQLIDPEALEVSFRVSTAQYSRLLDARGRLTQAPARVTLDVLGLDLEASGKLSRVSAAVGEGQTGRLIFASLDSFAGFRPGDFVTIRVQEPELDNVAKVPATAVDAAATVLKVGEADRLESAAVEVMRRQGDEVLIRAPDLTGAQIVRERSPLVGPGIRVRVLGAEPAEQVARAAPNAGGAPRPAAAGGGGGGEMVALTDERRAALIAFVEGNGRMPAQAKERVLAQLSQPEVPARLVQRLEGRMGG